MKAAVAQEGIGIGAARKIYREEGVNNLTKEFQAWGEETQERTKYATENNLDLSCDIFQVSKLYRPPPSHSIDPRRESRWPQNQRNNCCAFDTAEIDP